MIITDLILPVVVAVVISLVLSFVMEQLLLPRPLPFWRRPVAAFLLHCGLWLALSGFTLIVWQRPFFMAFNALAILAVLVAVSIVKFQALREPFIYQDLEYFTDLLRHPRLYLPFFGVWRALLCLLGYGVIVAVDLYCEPALPMIAGIGPFALAVVMMAVGVLLAWRASKQTMCVGYGAHDDLQRLGFAAALWHYGAAEKKQASDIVASSPFVQTTAIQKEKSGVVLPDLVVIQSESFFDARRQYPQLNPTILSRFDQLKQEAAFSGRLQVAAWGANTVRTEFGFLSGLSASVLGVHQYNPYRKLVSPAFPSIASYLRTLGYRTVCIHPYVASFYTRNRIYPMLGFDEFIDIQSFGDAEYAGQYVSDAAVADKIRALLEVPHTQPLFLFSITMENHGPLHWDNATDKERDALLQAPLDNRYDDLVSYAYHLSNADKMFGSVAEALRNNTRPGALCIYGDHVPIMKHVYRDLGEPDGKTEYLCWSSADDMDKVCTPLGIDELATRFLRMAGVYGERKQAEEMHA